MTNAVLLAGFIAIIITVATVIGLIRFAYQVGRTDATREYADRLRKRAEDLARDLQDFNTDYAGLSDEELKDRLRNL